MMNVQKYLMEHGLAKLKEEFFIDVTDYPDRVVLNYNQIESPRFHPIVDECRALILRKGTWEVMARSFDRFYNFSEGVDASWLKNGIEYQRVPSIDSPICKQFSFKNALLQDKLDGSLMSYYFDGEKWCVSTRKMAFAEGQTTFGRTFAEVFNDAKNKTGTDRYLSMTDMRDYTFVFELTGPENRVVTPYSECKITLIGCRLNWGDFKEMSSNELNFLSEAMQVDRPQRYVCDSFDELIVMVKSFPTMQEGIVMVVESESGSHWRLKCKNPQYVAIAHMRDNGNISPKRILALIMVNEHLEYLKYFPEDKKYFDFVEAEYLIVKNRINQIFKENIGIKEQKEFALKIMPKTVFSFEKGVIFSLRKNGGTVDERLNDLGAKKVAIGMDLKKAFVNKFHVTVEDEEETP